jgi:flagellar biosynthesis anti-sigma factor FlgM
MKGITGNPALDAYQRFAVSPVSPATPARAAEPAQQKPVSNEAAQVRISNEARALASQGSGDVDVQKVSALRDKIQAGTFEVNPQLVAQRMIEALG